MPKHKKRRSKRLSSSSEEDEKVSKRHGDTHHSKHLKRKKAVKSYERCEKDQKKTVGDDPRTTREIKKPVYRHPKRQATEEEEQCKTTKSVSVSPKGEGCSSRERKITSGKDKSRSGRKTEGGTSKTLDNNNVATTKGKASEDRLDKTCSTRTSSKSKRQQMSPTASLSQQEDKRQSRKSKTEERPRTENESRTVKTSERTTSVSKDSLEPRRREMLENMSFSHQVKESPAKNSLCASSKNASASSAERSIPSAKQTPSVSSLKELKSDTAASVNDKPVSGKTAQPPSTQKQLLSLKFVPFKFRIPKKVKPKLIHSTFENRDTCATNKNAKHEIKPSDSKDPIIKTKEETIQPVVSCSDETPTFPREEQDESSSLSVQLTPPGGASAEPWNDQMQVVEELHLARYEKRLEVNVMESYGELTCMDIDSPEEGPADSPCRQLHQQVLILVLDTNVLLSHLDYVKKTRSHGLGAMGFPVVLIPWVVLQELDSLKRGRGLSGSVAHLAIPAISYIYNALKNREPHLWGQSMQQAAGSSNGLNTENNDDRVLQCCLQYQDMYPECALILCTNDKNLCSKALLSGVRAFCKSDLEAEVEKSNHGLHNVQSIQAPMLAQLSSTFPSGSCMPSQPQRQEKACLSVGVIEKESQQLSKRDDGESKRILSACISELEECLLKVLSEVLEGEMKAAYEDLWTEIVYINPPWTLGDVLQCLKKHWIAVFGHVAQRKMLENVTSLIDFFHSGEPSSCHAASVALQEAKELVKAFSKSSNHVPHAITIMENIFNKLHPQHHASADGKSSACDVVMNDDEDKHPTSAQVSHQEVWAIFENIWSNVYQLSLEVFKALGFDPHTMQATPPTGDAPPPQDASACLHKLSSMVSQLLQAFSSVLSSASGLEEVQALLSVIHSTKIVNEVSMLTAEDLLYCFAQPDYREKLRIGGSQLMELKGALDCCLQATGQHMSSIMQH